MKEPEQASYLDSEGLLASHYWFDQPYAHDVIDQWLESERVDEAGAERLRQFVDLGYTVLDLEIDESIFEGIDRRVNELWSEKPDDLAFAYRSPLRPMSEAREDQHRRPSCRIADLHSHCEQALELYLHSQIFATLRLLFGSFPIATQSLYFEYGSQQQLHRDPVHVYMKPPSALLAAWIALEDITPGSGPLTYVPGSHRLPYYQIEPGIWRFDHHKHSDEEARKMGEFDLEQCRHEGLEVVSFLPRRGQALIWHHSLLHGGSYPEKPEPTRKSFVVHYSTMGNYYAPVQSIQRSEPGPHGAPFHLYSTRQVLSRGHAHGFDNPMRGVLLQ